MGLKGYRLWVMGQLDSTCRAPPRWPQGSAFSASPGSKRTMHTAQSSSPPAPPGVEGLALVAAAAAVAVAGLGCHSTSGSASNSCVVNPRSSGTSKI
jgi:hypothetical protein